MPFPIHPHMLRHACGYALGNAGHDSCLSPSIPTGSAFCGESVARLPGRLNDLDVF
jgi:hypothetical protein